MTPTPIPTVWDYPMDARPAFARPFSTDPAAQFAHREEVPLGRAIIRTDTNDVICRSVSSSYRILTNQRRWDWLVSTFLAPGYCTLVAASINKGGTVPIAWFQVTDRTLTLPDSTNNQASIYIWYRGDMSAGGTERIAFTCERPFCRNQMHSVFHGGRGLVTLSLRHTGDLDAKLEAAENAFLSFLSKITTDLPTTFALLRDHQISRLDANEYFRSVITPPLEGGSARAYAHAFKPYHHQMGLKNYLAREDADGPTTSLWQAMNALTAWIQHSRPITRVSSASSQSMYQATDGPLATLSIKAQTNAVALLST